MESAEAALDRLCDPQFEVSAHYLIGRCGTVWQLVRDRDRAWHAGAGSWGGQADINSRSIGIELDNRGTHPFSEPQMAALEGLLADLLARHDISKEGVIGHADMAPDRKIDPGPRFDWPRLARRGLSVWPEESPPSDPDGIWDNLTRFGYPGGSPDAATLRAFRARFAPWASGAVSAREAGIAACLARRWPAKLL